jgi:hypothetical protein
MSYTDADLTHEIASIVSERFDREQPIAASDVALHIISQHMGDFQQGGDFASYCAWHTTRKAVGSYLCRHFRDDAGQIKQLRFPGFENLQAAYLIEVDGAPVVVPLDQLTADDLERIAQRLEREGRAKTKHAEEVRRFRRARFQELERAA